MRLNLYQATIGELVRLTTNAATARERRLLILSYHRVLPSTDPMLPGLPDQDAFEIQMKVVAQQFNPLTLSRAIDLMKSGSLPPRSLSITFDDGYADNFNVAHPILNKYGIPATIFVASGFLDGGRMFNDTVIEAIRRISGDTIHLPELGLPPMCIVTKNDRAKTTEKIISRLRYKSSNDRLHHANNLARIAGGNLPNDLMLTSAQLRELHAQGIEIGAHTVSHPILSSIRKQEAIREITECRSQLSKIIDSEIYGFAYPNGKPGNDYDLSHVDMVAKSGFTYAVTTARGACSEKTDRYQLPRFGPWNRTPVKFGLRLAREFMTSPTSLLDQYRLET